jgi:hypothetical protein
MKRLRLVLLALPVALVGAGAGFLAARCQDDRRVDDADLELERLALAPGDNAFDALERAAALVAWPEGTDDWIAAALEGEPGRRADARRLVAANERALEVAAVAAAAPALQVPRMESPDDRSGDLLGWKRIVSLLCLRAWMDADDRNASAALDGFLDAARLAQRIAGAHDGALVHFVVGVSAKDVALGSLRRFADRAAFDAEDRARAERELARLTFDDASWRGLFAAEHRAMRADALAFVRAPLERTRAGAPLEPWRAKLSGMPRVLQGPAAAYLVKPNRTLNQMADAYRELGALGPRGCAAAMNVEPPSSAGDSVSALELALPDGLGDALVEHLERRLRYFVARRCVSDAATAATRVHLALRAYFADHGELPDSLAALVPRYLAAAPRDAFGDAPLRYSRERRIVWSVGRDLRDEGGRAADAPTDLAEPTFELAFVAPLGETVEASARR